MTAIAVAGRDVTRPFANLSAKTNDILFSVLLGIVLTTLSYVVATSAGWITEVNYLEAFAVFTSYSCTYLCVRERRINYPIGAISNAAYSLLFWQYGLIGSSFVTGYLTFALIYGWFRWERDDKTRPVRHVELKWVPAYIVSTAIFYGIAYAGVTALGGQMAPVDAAILIGSILAQFLLDNKRIETWVVWAIVNVAAIYLYFTSGLALAGFQYVFFLFNTLAGFYMWRKSMQERAA